MEASEVEFKLSGSVKPNALQLSAAFPSPTHVIWSCESMSRRTSAHKSKINWIMWYQNQSSKINLISCSENYTSCYVNPSVAFSKNYVNFPVEYPHATPNNNLPIATIDMDERKTGVPWHEWANWQSHLRSLPNIHFRLLQYEVVSSNCLKSLTAKLNFPSLRHRITFAVSNKKQWHDLQKKV